MKYQNPIIPGFNPDPSICRVGDDFYLATSTFEFFPGIPIYHSKNLINWELINYCLVTDSQLPLEHAPASAGLYAPTLRYHDGLFYMTNTNVSSGGNFIVHTDDIRGKWSEPVRVKQGGIDPSLFWDDDGKCYFMTNGSVNPADGQGIYFCEIDPLTGAMLSGSVRVTTGSGGRCAEAPHLYKHDGYYYLMLAEGGTEYGHMVTMLRARDVYGPYEKCPRNPILSHRDHQPLPIQGTGHADIVEDTNGNWWLVCLAIRPIPRAKLHHLGRETFLSPMTWDEDGWPRVGVDGRGILAFEMDGPLPGPAPTPVSFDFSDDFTGEALDLHWNFVRNPRRDNYRLSRGALTMIGGADDLSTPCGHPTMVAVRQQTFGMQATGSLEGEVSVGQCSGLSAFYCSDYHYDVYVTRKEDGCYVCLRKRVADIDVVTACHKIDYQGSLRLRIESDALWYTFSYETADGFVELGRGKTALLGTEGHHPTTYTGTYLGAFCEQGEITLTHFAVKERA